MKLSAYAMLLGSFVFTGCAVNNIPEKRPMQEAYLEKITNPVAISIPDGQEGIATTFFAQDSSAMGAQYGLIGALTTAVIDSVANATPAAIAQDGANLINTKIQQTMLEDQLLDALKAHKSANSQLQIDLSKLHKVDLIKTKNAPVEGLLIDSTYAFSYNAELLRVSTNVTLNVAGVAYKTPYKFEKKIPKNQLTGPIYFNRFNYFSQIIPSATKSPEEIAKTTATIQEKYKTPAGTLPKKGTKSEQKMRRELKAANADYNPKEKFDITINEWMKDDAKLLRAEIQAANAFLAQQLMQDLQSFETPSINGTNVILTTTPDGRTITRIGSTTAAGAIESTPEGGINDVQRRSFGWNHVYAEDEAAEKAKRDAAEAKRNAKKKKR